MARSKGNIRQAGFARMVEELSSSRQEKLFAKVPEWRGLGVSFPSGLATEQCSSSATALFKAGLVPGGCAVADITGGLGVDLWAFATTGHSPLLYNDMNAALMEAVRANYAALGIDGVQFCSAEVVPGGVSQILGCFKPDVIFLDPARRSSSGSKVYRLADCSPDLAALRAELLELAPKVLAKLSPMADMSEVLRELAGSVSRVFVLGSAGECKELVVELTREGSEQPPVIVADCGSGASLEFTRAQEQQAQPALLGPGALRQGALLFEPSAALMKAGCYNLLSQRFGMAKLALSTHLYLADSIDNTLAGLGKYYSVGEILEFSSSTIKQLSSARLAAELTARNLPVKTDGLRKRLKLSPADPSDPQGQRHLFACASNQGAVILDTRRVTV